MNEDLKNKLIAALKEKGLDEGIAKFVSINEESEIEGAVASLVTSLPELTKEQKIADKEVQSEIDRRVTTAIDKVKNEKPNPTPDDPPKPTADDTPEWAKSIIDQNKSLSEKITNIEKGKETETKQQQALSALQKSEVLNDSVKSKWANRIDINSEVSFEEQVKGLESEFTELRQGVADSAELAGNSPTFSKGDKASDKELDSILDKI